MKKLFIPPDARALARQELAETERHLLRTLTRLEHAQAEADAYRKTIARLTTYLKEKQQ